MGEHMKNFLKITLFSLLAVIGVLGILIGALYIFTGFKDEQIYATELHFTSPEVITSSAYGLQIESTTENVNMKTLKLEVATGDENIINFPEYVTIGQPFFISPIKDNGGNNVGGFVELYARYDLEGSNQGVVGKCKILVDVPVQNISIDLHTSKIEKEEEIFVVKNGECLDTVFNVYPLNSMSPYVNKNNFNSSEQDSIFANFADKKIFLEITDEDGNRKSDIATFLVEQNSICTEQPIVEVKYSYDSSLTGNLPFVFTQDIKLKAKETITVIYVNVYVCSGYENQDDVTIDNVSSSSSISSGNSDIVIADYSVDGISVTNVQQNIYYNEQTTLFLNSNKKGDNFINLDIKLLSDAGDEKIHSSLLKNNVFISIEDDINCQLSKLDENKTIGNNINVDFDGISNDKNEWGLQLYFRDFEKYFNYYKNSSSNDNKIKLTITYKDEDVTHSTSIYLIPAIKKVLSINPKYLEGDQFFRNSGDVLKLDNSNFEFTYENGLNATITNIGYFLSTSLNNIQTVPTLNDIGTYNLKFDFTPNSTGNIVFSSNNYSWCSLRNVTFTFSQGSTVAQLNFDNAGMPVNNIDDFVFSAGKEISVVVTNINITNSIPSDTSIFDIKINNNSQVILANSVVFYNTRNLKPYLYVNNMTYDVDFKFVTINGEKYLYILDSSGYNYYVSGMGEIILTARVIFVENNVLYDLNVSTEVEVYVSKTLDEIDVYSYDNDTKTRSVFDGNLVYNENLGQTNYLIITTKDSQMDALELYILNNLLTLNFNQDFSSVDFSKFGGDETLKKALEINQNAITFGDFEKVFDSNNKLTGFKISYIINEVYTININNVNLPNIFNLSFSVSLDDNDIFASFICDNEEKNIMPITINDLAYTQVGVYYTENTNYGTQDNPLVLQASVNNGNFYYSIFGNYFNQLDNLLFGLKNQFSDELSYSNFIKYSFTTTSNSITNADNFISLDNQSKKFTIKSIPFTQDGILFKLNINANVEISSSTNEFDNLIYYYYNGSSFIKKLNENLQDGFDYYILVKGLDFKVTANKDVNFDGIKGNNISIFGNNALFSITNSEGSIISLNDYSKLLNMNVSISDSSAISISSDYSQISFLKDFAGITNIDFRFYFGLSSITNNIPIYIDQTNFSNSYSHPINSAFIIEINSDFDAPSTNNSLVKSITYKGGDGGDALESGIVDYFIQIVDSNSPIKVVDKTISFSNIMTKTTEHTIKIVLSTINEEGSTIQSSIYSYTITATSKFNQDDLSLGSDSSLNVMTAGINYGFSYQANTIKYSNFTSKYLTDYASYLLSIDVTFEDIGDYPVLASEHLRANTNSFYSLSIYSYDLNFEKSVSLTIKYNFDFNKDKVADEYVFFTKTITILPNLEISLNREVDPSSGRIILSSSGESLNLGLSTSYIYKQNGVQGDINLSGYTKQENFQFNEKYFDIDTSSSILIIKVKNASQELPSGDYNESIRFTYIVKDDLMDVKYNLIFEFDILVRVFD